MARGGEAGAYVGAIARRAMFTLLRRLTSRRLRPSLVIVGAQKAGTTTLFDILAQHPQIIPPKRKEISFFNREERYEQGMGAYWREFPPATTLGRRRITLDASPMYLYHPQAAERIARHLPQAWCMVVLRDPVERAFSAWNMYHGFKDDPRHGHLYDPRSFEQAVEDELSGKVDIPARRYLDRSKYLPQLARYLQHVGRERLIIEQFERLKSDAAALVNEVLGRLGLDPMPLDHPAFASRSNTRSYQQAMDPGMARMLAEHFRDDQIAVARLLRDSANA